jgi:hypothetical protein
VWLGKQHRGQPRFVARKKGEFRPISGREDAEGEGGRGEIIFTTEAQSTRRIRTLFFGFLRCVSRLWWGKRSRTREHCGEEARTQREKEGTEKAIFTTEAQSTQRVGTLFFWVFTLRSRCLVVEKIPAYRLFEGSLLAAAIEKQRRPNLSGRPLKQNLC